MEESLLKGKPFALLDESLVEKVCGIVKSVEDINNPPEPEVLDEAILSACNFSNNLERHYDSRIEKAIATMENTETISENTIAQLAEGAFLSQSRFSHLFKEQTGMSLASWIAFEKLRKTYKYLLNGKPVFGKNCVSCGACIQNCTKNAIHHAEEKSSARYRNPHINISELIYRN